MEEPLTASHILDAVIEGQADAVAIASVLHYSAINRNSNLVTDFQEEGNIEFLKGGTGTFKKFGKENLKEIKIRLSENGLVLRQVS